MAEKTQLVDAQKELDALSLSVSSAPSPSPRFKSGILIRFCQVLSTVGLLYCLRSWLYHRSGDQNIDLTLRPYPTDIFSHSHSILNGQLAEQIYL